MNIVVLCSDTFRADVLGCYGDRRVHTPNLDKLASEGIVFENAYTEGLPTIPARKIYLTGRRLFPRWKLKLIKGDPAGYFQLMGWYPLPEEEITFTEILRGKDVLTGLITDVYHYFKPGQNLHRYFDSWQWVRGQEIDPYITGPRKVTSIDNQMRKEEWHSSRFLKSAIPSPIRGAKQYPLNISKRKKEENYFAPQVMLKAMEWLEDNAQNRPFLLWVDCFDPHEPWDPPKEYADMYCSNYRGVEPIFAQVRSMSDFSPAEQERVKALYFGEVTLVDKWIGKVLEKIKSLKLEDDTVVIFTSDHGTILGEFDKLHKHQNLLIRPEVQLPLIIRYPDDSLKEKRIKGFVQSIDFMPTLLDILNVDIPDRVEGHSFLPLMKGEERDLHPEGIVTAFGDYVSLRDEKWNYINCYRGENAGKEPQLFNLEQDPKETKNAASDYSEVVKSMQDKIDELMRKIK